MEVSELSKHVSHNPDYADYFIQVLFVHLTLRIHMAAWD